MSKNRIPYIEENTIDVAAAVNDSLRVVDGVVTDRVEAIVDELPQDAKQSDKYAVNAGDKAGLIAKFVETDAGGFWEYFDSVLCELNGAVYVSDGKAWQGVKSNGVLPDNVLTTDDLHNIVDNTEDKAVTPKAVKDAIDAIDIPSMPDDYLTQDDVQQELSESYKPVSAKAVKIAIDNIDIGDVDLSEYRKLDNNNFDSTVKINAKDNVGAGVFLLCPDNKVRGQIVYNSYGLQFAQVQGDGTAQTFTFPRYGDGGEILLNKSITSEAGDSKELVASQKLVNDVNNQILGVNQKWTDVKSSRVVDTDYINNTGKPIFVSISVGFIEPGKENWYVFKVDDFDVVKSHTMAQVNLQIMALVPHGSKYSLREMSSTDSKVVAWAELR